MFRKKNYFFGIWSLGMITGLGFGCTLSFGTWTEITKISFEYIYFNFFYKFLNLLIFIFVWFFCLKMIFQPLVVTDWMIKISFPFTPFIFNMNERLSRFFTDFHHENVVKQITNVLSPAQNSFKIMCWIRLLLC